MRFRKKTFSVPVSSERLNRLPPYIFAVMDQRLQHMLSSGLDVIRLDIGSPDMPPPNVVIEELANSAWNPNNHGYSGYRGIASFRAAVARYYQTRFGISVDPEREVLPLIGSKEGIVNLCFAYLDADDIALVPDIGYPSYSMGARLAGADIHWLPVRDETGYLPDLSSIPHEVAQRAKLLWVNYPNNPTGATADEDFYEQATQYCSENDILLASDNPYMDVVFDGYRAGSALQATNAKSCVVEFMSFSKTYNMGGWRLGAAVGCPDALKKLLHVKSNMDSGHFRPVYEAGIAALEHTSQEWIDERNRIYQLRRDRLMEILPEIGLSAQRPHGTLYVWARVEDGDGQTYAEEALNIAHVSIAPGEAYGPGGKQYVRFSVGMTDDRFDLALERLKGWYANR
jgi:LL-diaminopimelate aminotransferase